MSVRKYLPFIILAVAGCSDHGRKPVYPVSGAVFVHGEPAAGARIFLSPTDHPGDPRALRPFAVVDKDGAFRLTTYNSFDGAPEGEYVVTLTWSAKPAGASGNDDGAFPDRLKSAYGNPRTSKLRAKVAPGPNHLEPFRLN